MKNNKKAKIGFAAPLNKLEWENDVQKQLNILQLSCLLSYSDVGRDVVQSAAEYLNLINSDKCNNKHLEDKNSAFRNLIDNMNTLIRYQYYPNNFAEVLPDVIHSITNTLISNMNAGNEYYIGCMLNRYHENFKLKLMQYGKDLNATLDSIINEVYNIPFEVYPKCGHYRKKDQKVAFDLVDERIIELYSKTLKDADEVYDTYVNKTFSIYNSKFQMNITVKDSSKAEHKTVKTLISQPVILELDELKFDDASAIDDVVMSTLLTTMFTKSEKQLKQLVKNTLIQVETYQPDDESNVQAAKNFVVKKFLQIDFDKSVRSILYSELNDRFSSNYNLSRLSVQDEMDNDFTYILHKLANVILARYEQLEPVYTTYYRILKECGQDSLKRRTTRQGYNDHLYIQYHDKEKDRNYRIMRITAKSR